MGKVNVATMWVVVRACSPASSAVYTHIVWNGPNVWVHKSTIRRRSNTQRWDILLSQVVILCFEVTKLFFQVKYMYD